MTSPSVSSSEIAGFQAFIQKWFQRYGRTDYPWRQTSDPYHVLVSEVMLQQTQTDRVVPKYLDFLASFPTVQALAEAGTDQVITAWQGLGYNRRGLHLHQAAKKIVSEFNGQIPNNETDLLSLPGIGPYTAAAIAVFAFKQPSTVIETNIRGVFLHHFFPAQTKVADQSILPLIAATLDQNQPHQWYSALMDYGAYLKKVLPNPSRRSKHHAKQSRFQGSNRQLRGAIIRHISSHQQLDSASAELLAQELDASLEKTWQAANQLVAEGFLTQREPYVFGLASK